MTKWKQILCAALVVGTIGAFAADTYTSDGFSAKISNAGMIQELKYKDQLLCNLIQMNGDYPVPQGVEKYDSRFFQSMDYTGKAVSKRDGNTMTVTIDSKLGNKVLKDAVDYKVETVFTPNKITVKSSAKLNVPLQTHAGILRTIMSMPPTFFGRGVKCVTKMNQERFEVLPETYNKAFKLNGQSLALSTGKGTFTLLCGKDDSFSFMDSRSWGGKDFSFTIAGPAKWTQNPVTHPAGTVYNWEFTLTFEPEK